MYTDNELLNSFKVVYQSMGRQRHHASISNTVQLQGKLISTNTMQGNRNLGVTSTGNRSEHSSGSQINRNE